MLLLVEVLRMRGLRKDVSDVYSFKDNFPFLNYSLKASKF